MNKCEICNEYIFSFEKHTCKPKWLCRIRDDSDEEYSDDEGFDFKEHAYSANTAAEQLAERKDPDYDHAFVGDGGVNIDVKNCKTGEITGFYVSAEPTISYYASERE